MRAFAAEARSLGAHPIGDGMMYRFQIVCIGLMLFVACSNPAVSPAFPDERWESSTPTKVRITRQYREGDDYYTFAAKAQGHDAWQNITTIRRDATGEMPVENVRSINRDVTYFFLVDQFLVTTDGGRMWSQFDVSKHLQCGSNKCAWIKQVTIDNSGTGHILGSRHEGKQLLEFELKTIDFGRTWSTKGA